MGRQEAELREQLESLDQKQLVERVIALQTGKIEGSEYDDKAFQRVLDEIMEGKSVRRILSNARKEVMNRELPRQRTFYSWLSDERLNKVFDTRKRYESAKLVHMYDMQDEIIEIADDGTNDWMEKVLNEDGDTRIVFDHEHVQRSKLRIEVRERMMIRTAPHTFDLNYKRNEDAMRTNVRGERVVNMVSVDPSEVPPMPGGSDAPDS